MAMRETVRSLKAYFILTGLLGAAMNVISLLRYESVFASAVDVVSLAFCLGYLYVGLRLRRLLATAPRQVLTPLIATAVFLVVLLMLSVLSGAIRATWPTIVIGGLITWYLYANVRRLAGESQPAQAEA